jgi:hypothetical protein
MSDTDLVTDKQQTFDAVHRLIESGKVGTGAFRKLVDRLAWLNTEQLRRGTWTPVVTA